MSSRRSPLRKVLQGCGILIFASFSLHHWVATMEQSKHLRASRLDEAFLLPSAVQNRTVSGTRKRKRRKPRLIIHAGPGKTGTSTIQFELGGNLTEPLAQDGYVYMGKEGPLKERLQSHLIKCTPELEEAFNKTGSYDDVTCWQQFQVLLKRHYDHGDNIILSGEEFTFGRMPDRYRSKAFRDTFWKALQDWDILVVIVYRRYGEWLLSAKRQDDGQGCLRRWKPHGGDWPHLTTGGLKCFETWKVMKKYHQRGRAFQYLYANVGAELFHELNWTTTFLNFHDKGHITTNLLCDVIQDAPNACEFSRQHPDKAQVNKRTHHATMYDDIVVDAAKNGLIDLNRTREEVNTELQQRVPELSLPDLPLQCPSRDQLEWLLNESLTLEEQLMPELYASSMGKDVGTAEFWRIANEEKAFCTVDTDRLLSNVSSWDDLVDSLAAASVK